MRNWLKRAPKGPEAIEPAPLTVLLAQLESRIEALAGSQAQLQLAWQETLDKITAWANRAAARDRRALEIALRSSESDDPDPGGPGHGNGAETAEQAKQALRRRVFGTHS